MVIRRYSQEFVRTGSCKTKSGTAADVYSDENEVADMGTQIRLFSVDRTACASYAVCDTRGIRCRSRGDIVQQLDKITHGDSPSANFARDIRDSRSNTITFDDPEYGRHDPDASFRHSGAQYPGVVIEVAYSQKARALPRLADDYILGSDDNIRVVVGLKIEYLHKTATLSVWKPQRRSKGGDIELAAEQTVADQVGSRR